MDKKKMNIIGTIAIMAMIYLSLPSNNASPDAYDYACSAKYGIDLFHPHHLLFNGFFHLEYKILGFIFPTIDVLKMMQATNALFALATLGIAFVALKKICSPSLSRALVLFCGCTFGMLRFATDGETYIIPLFFCILSTLLFIQEIQADNMKFAFWSGLSFAIACLFHQTALFWGIGLWIGFLVAHKRRSVILFTLATLTIPIVYIVAMPKTEEGCLLTELFRFMTDYYHSDSADTQLGWKNLIMTPISLFRTIYQVHGNIPTLLKGNFFFIFFSIIAVIEAILGFVVWFVVYKANKNNRSRRHLSAIETSHIIAFSLSLLFAFFSHGNAEFMVMLPLCAAFFLYPVLEDYVHVLHCFSISALCWNVMTAIAPSNQYNYYNEEAIVGHIYQHPDASYLLREKNSVSNKYFYRFGERPKANLVRADREERVRELKRENIKNPSLVIYTDVLSRPTPLSRGTLLGKEDFSCRKSGESFRITCHMGDYTLDQITFNEE